MTSPASKRSGYRIPKEGVVVEAVLSVLESALTVRSQTLFHRLVMSRLREMGQGSFRLSPKRLRRITARLENVDLLIYCREGKAGNRRTRCPVCGTSMEDIKNSTLYGWTVSTGKFCPTCGYWTGNRERIPIRYVFTLDKERYVGEELNGKGGG